MADEKKVVIPGAELGTEEEFANGRGTFVESGKVYSSLVGSAAEKDRSIAVERPNALAGVEQGTLVYGMIENIIEPIALVSILPQAIGGKRFALLPGNAVLHASSIKRGGYVKNVRDEVRVGDIVKAKVMGMREGDVMLTLAEEELGVVKAFCSKDRSPMKLENGSLVCEKCENKEFRKLAKDYRV